MTNFMNIYTLYSLYVKSSEIITISSVVKHACAVNKVARE